MRPELIKWSEQHGGVHLATYNELRVYMPDVLPALKDFPKNPENFMWDVKVHMLMPSQYPCIPNWHFDAIPRVNGVQDFSAIKPEVPMYLWLSGAPLTVFRKDGIETPVEPLKWHRFTQEDEHRGTPSDSFTWRGFIRATHKDIAPKRVHWASVLRRHTQVYLDAKTFTW